MPPSPPAGGDGAAPGSFPPSWSPIKAAPWRVSTPVLLRSSPSDKSHDSWTLGQRTHLKVPHAWWDRECGGWNTGSSACPAWAATKSPLCFCDSLRSLSEPTTNCFLSSPASPHCPAAYSASSSSVKGIHSLEKLLGKNTLTQQMSVSIYGVWGGVPVR